MSQPTMPDTGMSRSSKSIRVLRPTFLPHRRVRYFGSSSTKALYKYDLGGTSAIEDPATVAVKVTVYPNPATERIFITTHQDIKTVQIYDLSGVQVLETAADNIDVSALNGIYFVKIVLADGHQVVEKIVVK